MTKIKYEEPIPNCGSIILLFQLLFFIVFYEFCNF